MRTYVYFLRRGDHIKIGWSCVPDTRARNLRGLLLAVIPFESERGGPWWEKAEHRRWHHLSLGREWFRAGPELLWWIARLQRWFPE